jgi:hypothetical protein
MTPADAQRAKAWRQCLLDDKGNLTPNGEIVMRDLERACGWMVTTLPVDATGRTDPYKAAAELSKRGIYAHVRKRLFGDTVPFVEGTETP